MNAAHEDGILRGGELEGAFEACQRKISSALDFCMAQQAQMLKILRDLARKDMVRAVGDLVLGRGGGLPCPWFFGERFLSWRPVQEHAAFASRFAVGASDPVVFAPIHGGGLLFVDWAVHADKERCGQPESMMHAARNTLDKSGVIEIIVVTDFDDDLRTMLYCEYYHQADERSRIGETWWSSQWKKSPWIEKRSCCTFMDLEWLMHCNEERLRRAGILRQ